jgi:proline dehydrogenase
MGAADSTIHSLIRRAARAYVAGPTLENARAVCDRLARDGVATTVCYWDVYSDHPAFISQAYMKALQTLSDNTSDCYLSIKAPALKFDMKLITKVLEEARRLSVIVHFDAVAPDTVDRTFELISRAHDIYPKIGCTLPGRWRRSLADVDCPVEMGLRVRVVKGEWKGLGNDERDPREGFLEVIERLAGRATHVAVATHNPTIARLSLRRLKDAGTPCELELLYGLPQQPLLRIARAYGVRARMYVPYGHARLPYRLTQAVRNPRIIGWFLHDLFRGR